MSKKSVLDTVNTSKQTGYNSRRSHHSFQPNTRIDKRLQRTQDHWNSTAVEWKKTRRHYSNLQLSTFGKCFIFSNCFILLRVMASSEKRLCIGWDACPSPCTHTHTSVHSFTHRSSLVPIHLLEMFLEGEKKPENPEETMWRTCRDCYLTFLINPCLITP